MNCSLETVDKNFSDVIFMLTTVFKNYIKSHRMN